jgi:hypothetical protein
VITQVFDMSYRFLGLARTRVAMFVVAEREPRDGGQR